MRLGNMSNIKGVFRQLYFALYFFASYICAFVFSYEQHVVFSLARGKFMSVFVSIVQGEHDAILPWPFHHEIKLTLLDQCENPDERKHVKFAIKPNPRLENKSFLARPEKDRNASFGAQNFVELDVIKKFSFVKDDTIFLTCNVDTTDINNYI